MKVGVLGQNGRAALILSFLPTRKIINNQSDVSISTGFLHHRNETLLTRVSTKNAQSEHAYGLSSTAEKP